MAFDPDQYLAEKTGGSSSGFDPDKYLAEKTGGEGPSSLEAGARGVAQGASFGFADEIAGGAEALWDKIKGLDTPFADAYRKHRDESRANFKAAQDADSTAYGAGQIGGGVLSGLAAAPLTGGASLGSAVALGAGGGALSALGEADELDAQAAEDVLKGGAMGGAFGAAGHGAGKLAAKGINALTSKVAPAAAEALDDVAIAQGRRALSGGLKSNLDDEVVRHALENNVIRTGKSTPEMSEALESMVGEAGPVKGAFVNSMEALGAPRVDANILARTLRESAENSRKTTLGQAPEIYEEMAKRLENAADDAGGLGFNQLESLKTSAQQNARKHFGAIVDTEKGGAFKDVAAKLREAGEWVVQQVEEGAPNSGELLTQFKNLKRQYGMLEAARVAAAKGTQAVEGRSVVGPTAKLAMLAGAATGDIRPALTGGAKHLYDTRGASTIARTAFDLSKSLGRVGAVAVADPAKLGKYGSVLASAAQRSPEALNSAIYVLGMSDPEFQKLSNELGDDAPPDDGAVR